MSAAKTILITGAAGLVGCALIEVLVESTGYRVVATDIKPPSNLPEAIEFRTMDVTGVDPDLVIGDIKPDVIVHLASIVTAPKGTGRDFAYEVDVMGTRKVLDAAIKHKTKRIVVTSSGAAYGYHKENINPLVETDPIRGNQEFPYSYHKMLVERMLAETRERNPELEQVVLRVGTVLGAGTENQITALFHKRRLLAVRGCDSPFVFIWTKDLARILKRAAIDGPAGIFNAAADGVLGINDFSQKLGKSVVRIPAWVLKLALAIAKPLGLSQYGPEQVRFLQYRPVLDNTKLKQEFGYTPELTSAEVFDLWKRHAGL